MPPDCTTELNHNAYLFLQSIFDKHDKVKVFDWQMFIRIQLDRQERNPFLLKGLDKNVGLKSNNRLSSTRL